MQKLLGAAVACSSHPPLAIMPRIKTRAPVAVFASCHHALLPSMSDRRSSGRLRFAPRHHSLIGEHARWRELATVPNGFLWDRSHFWQRHRHAHSAISSDFSSLVGRNSDRQTGMSLLLCGLMSLGQHTKLELHRGLFDRSFHWSRRAVTTSPHSTAVRFTGGGRTAGAGRLGLPVPVIFQSARTVRHCEPACPRGHDTTPLLLLLCSPRPAGCYNSPHHQPVVTSLTQTHPLPSSARTTSLPS
jgi:hypothetical protein